VNQALLVGLGGFVGTLVRYGLISIFQALTRSQGQSYPYGTLAANVLGCFFLGVALELMADRFQVSQQTRLALTIGFFGALTTFSTFAFETMSYFSSGNYAIGALNFALHNVLGFGAMWMGFRLAAWFL